MPNRMHHQLELVGRTATLYVSGALGYEDVDTLIGACAGAPPRARTLRVDLHALGQLSADALGAVRQILHYWRDTRHGDFRLTTSHMVATLREVPVPGYEPRMNEAAVGAIGRTTVPRTRYEVPGPAFLSR